MNATVSAEEFHAAVAATIEKPLVVFFSSSGCGGCTMVAPKMATLADELAPSATFIKVSAEALNAVCEDVEVGSFPHFRVYKETKILGDLTSSKVDKVDAFIRELVAPDTLQEGPETKEKEEEGGIDTVSKEEGSTKRQEREEMQGNEEHSAKKAKVEESAEGTDKAETIEEGSKEADEVVTEAPEMSAEVTEKKLEDAVSGDTVDSSDVTAAATA